jgi:hypothetical protein
MSLWRCFLETLRRMFAMESQRHLCDTCKYDYGNVCKRPERPNALKCPDYKHK